MNNTKSSSASVLLVEDEIITAQLQKKELEETGYTVQHVQSGEDALRAVCHTDSCFSIILMDIDLGTGMDGTQAAAKILDTTDIPIVFLSSHTEREIVAKTEHITSYGYVVKNTGSIVLDASIKMALRLFAAKQQEQAFRKSIQQSEEHLRITLNSIGDAVITTDLDGIITAINPVAQQLTGWTRNEALNKPIESVFRIANTITGETVPNPVRKVMHSGIIEGLANHTKLIARNGTEYQIADSGAPITDDEHTITGVVLVFRDVTAEYTMQEQLAESERQLKTAQHIGTMGSWRFNLSSGTVEASEEACRIYGINDLNSFTMSDVQQLPLTQYRPMLDEAMHALIDEGKPYDVTFKIARADTGTITDIRSIARYNAGENSLVGIIQDITNQTRAAETLAATKNFLYTVVEMSPFALWVSDTAGTLVQTNHTLRTTLNLTDQQLLATYNVFNDRNLSDQGLMPRVYDVYEKYIPARFTMQWNVHDAGIPDYTGGPEKHLDVALTPILDTNGTLTNVVCQWIDITQRVTAQEAYKRESALLTTIMETSPVGITTVDAEGNITYANSRAEEILGLERDEITARTYDAPLWNHTDLNGLPLSDEKQPFNIVKQTNAPVYDVQHGITWPGGYEVILSINASPIPDENGSFNGMIASLEDITAKKHAEETIIRQLQEKDILLKEVHHRIKNNMASIGHMLTLQCSATHNIEAHAILQDAVSRIESIQIIYEKLLLTENYAEISVLNYLMELIDAIGNIFTDTHHVTVHTDIDDFMLDVKRLFPLGIIVNELMTNVMKYAFPGNTDGTVMLSLKKEDDHIVLTTQDNGAGIAEDQMHEQSGTFGLTLVRMLSQQLHGSCTLENRDGTRCTVRFIY